ncbi:esterase E4-like [Tachypleus tridentatus]|uniref:esterase E4-like n=1 Tax=Tachypleus tridentatus TaxID=6853 RepID=UPI003FD4919C
MIIEISRHSWSFCLVSLVLLLYEGQMIDSEVKIPQGKVRGRILRTKTGRKFYGFMGIPFATPPLGPLRFKRPVRHPGWSDVLNADNFRSSCPQVDDQGGLSGDENCLFINVFTPDIRMDRKKENFSLFPVMVFIHGDNFETGSSDLYGPEKLVEKHIVLVTFNYRLGILGFLSTENEDMSGNCGLWDQQLALEWVRNNINYFQGDINSITLFGEGSGGASVMFHVISPVSQGMFQRAVSQSGSALCDWATEQNPRNYARTVAHLLGCPTESSLQLVECVREIPVSRILRVQREEKVLGNFPLRAVPVIDGLFTNDPFIPNHPKRLLASGNFRRIPLIIGINKDEGATLTGRVTSDYLTQYKQNPDYVRGNLVPKFIQTATNINANYAVIESVMFHYFNRINFANVTQVLLAMLNMTTDALYVSCIDQTAKIYSQLNIPTYFYVFQYRGSNSNAPRNPAFSNVVSHGDELFYQFNLQRDGKRPFSSSDSIIEYRMLTLWTDFVKFGETPHFLNYEFTDKWPHYKGDNEHFVFYSIGRDLKKEQNYRQHQVTLWLRHLPSLSNIETVLPSKLPLVEDKVEAVYSTLAWAIVAVVVALFSLVVLLLVVLYNQRRSHNFEMNSFEESSQQSPGPLVTPTLY